MGKGFYCEGNWKKNTLEGAADILISTTMLVHLVPHVNR